MKVFYLLALVALTATAIPVEDRREHGENGWYIPQIDGSWVWMNMDEAENKLAELENAENRLLGAIPVSFYLYTKSNPSEPQSVTETTESVYASNFNVTNPTRFLIHGWSQNYTTEMYGQIRDAWLTLGDFNIIVVDWERANSIEYVSSVAAVPKTGAKVARMVDFLVNNCNMSLSSLEVIGHSLGAHVAGFTGQNVKSGLIRKIVGLDPAFPLFSYQLPSQRLSSTDAFFVESIQTDGLKLGFARPIGRATFYPNGGRYQPGCGLGSSLYCSHHRSIYYYIEAVVENDFPTVKCGSWLAAFVKSCGNTYSSVRMAAMANDQTAIGEYYVPVNSEAPYGMGS